MERKVLYTSESKYCSESFEVDDKYAYVVRKYDKPYMDMLIRLDEVYRQNRGSIEINDEEQKAIVVDIAKSYLNFISIEESPYIFGDVYYKVELLKGKHILDGSNTIEICDAFLSPAIITDKQVLAFKWDICDSEWYIRNIQAYVTDEHKADFIQMLSFQKMFLGCIFSTRNCLDALCDVLDLLEKEDKKHKKHTYIFKDTTGYYMIGRTKNLPQRYCNVRVGNTTLDVVCHLDGDYTNQIHKDFAHRKIEGIWFDLTQDDIDKIKNYQNK